MAIRVATERDLPRVLEIERVSFPNPWPESLLRGHLGEGGFLIYEDDETREIVGYIIAGLRMPSFFERLERRTRALVGLPVDLDERRGHIMNLAVDPRHRGRGIGQALLREGLDYLRVLGAETVELEVRVGNEAAIKLYEKYGFRIKERLPGYYGPGEDGLLMVKLLRQPA
jgi:ribosomal-protein-alanine N-acetyltransferase